MNELVTGFLRDVISSIFEAFDNFLVSILESMVYVERLIDHAAAIVTASSIQNVYDFIYLTATGLIALKFLFKGFQVYILWRDGDADNSPQDMLIGAIQSIVVIVLFPRLYDMMADITIWFARSIMSGFQLSDTGILTTLTAQAPQQLGIFILILLLVYLIMLLVLYVKLIRRGWEVLILRLGVPIACIGLLDSDGGIFKTYMQLFYRTMFTSIIQIVLLSFSLRVMSSLQLPNLICGIALISTASGTPALMQQLLIPGGGRGGGMGSKIHTGSTIIRTVQSFVGR